MVCNLGITSSLHVRYRVIRRNVTMTGLDAEALKLRRAEAMKMLADVDKAE